MELLEYYSSHKSEIEVIADDRALFLLCYISRVGVCRVPTLATELGWSFDETVSELRTLDRGQFIKRLGRTVNITSAGRELLQSLGLLEEPSRSVVERPGRGGSSSLSVLLAVGVGAGILFAMRPRSNETRRVVQFLLGLGMGAGAGTLFGPV